MSRIGYTFWSLRCGLGPYRNVFYDHWGFGYWCGWRWFEWKPRREVYPNATVWHWIWFEVSHSKRGFHTGRAMRQLYEDMGK